MQSPRSFSIPDAGTILTWVGILAFLGTVLKLAGLPMLDRLAGLLLKRNAADVKKAVLSEFQEEIKDLRAFNKLLPNIELHMERQTTAMQEIKDDVCELSEKVTLQGEGLAELRGIFKAQQLARGIAPLTPLTDPRG